MTMRRRDFLLSSSAVATAGLLHPRSARAAPAEADTKFLFVLANGGWDIVQAFYDAAPHGNVHTPAGFSLDDSHGDLTYVRSDALPQVSTFFDAHWQQSLIVNGLWTNSVAHESCMKYLLTGGTAKKPDWGAIIASSTADRYTLPHVVVSGSSFAAQLGGVQTRVGTSGKLDGLITGDFINETDSQPGRHGADIEAVLNRHLVQRAEGVEARGEAHIDQLARYAKAMAESDALKHQSLSFSTTRDPTEQANFAMDALSVGLSRCASIAHMDWDTHQDNDDRQTRRFGELFSLLTHIMDGLSSRLAPSGVALSEETVVVVISEMGRTPSINADLGKDHWPVTSALVVGPGFSTGRTVGGFDELFYGQPIDPDTAEVDAAGVDISAGAFGATLLQRAGVDPGEWLPGFKAIPGLLS
jgi:hypothetical protein